MAAGIAIGAIVDLVGMEYFMNGFGSSVDIGEEAVAVFVGDVDDLTDMILICDDAAAAMALLLEENQLADIEIADLDSKRVEQLAAFAIAAVCSFDCLMHDISS